MNSYGVYHKLVLQFFEINIQWVCLYKRLEWLVEAVANCFIIVWWPLQSVLFKYTKQFHSWCLNQVRLFSRATLRCWPSMPMAGRLTHIMADFVGCCYQSFLVMLWFVLSRGGVVLFKNRTCVKRWLCLL